LSCGAGQVGLSSAIVSLPIPPVGLPFRALAVAAASGAELLIARKLLAVGAAISLAAITVGTNEEEAATLKSVAKDLAKRPRLRL
jgi:hypothetical protein